MGKTDTEGKKILLIINPRAGQMRSRTGLFDIVEVFCEHGLDVTVHTTLSAGDAGVHAQKHGGSFDMIACCGGDGTLNETVSGMIRGGVDVPIGYIPAGTTNDFATSLLIPKTIKKAALSIVGGNVRELDIGAFGNGDYFNYIASFGAFSRTSFETPQNVKNAVGHLAYLLNGASEIFNIKPHRVAVETEKEKFSDEVLFCGITNTYSIGGVIGLPKSKVALDDGKFEILMIKPPKNAIELNNMIVKLSKRDYEDENLRLITASSAEIHTEKGTLWTRDGENGGAHNDVKINVLRKRMKIILPDTNKK